MADSNPTFAKELYLSQAGFPVLPTGWDVVQIEELLSEDRGISVGVMYPGEHDPIGIPLIKAGDLVGNVISPTPEFRVTPAKHAEYRRTEFQGGEILMTLVGTVGQCAIVPPEMKGWNSARAVAVIRLADASDAQFVRHCLLSKQLNHLMNAWANTTVQATLNLKEIRQLPLPWPPKRERDAIANILSPLDDKIELNRRMNETLEGIARALFKSWFVDFDPVRAKMDGRQPAGMAPEIADLFPSEFEHVNGELVPKGWSIRAVPDAIDVNPTRRLSKGTIATYLDMKNMPTNGHHPDEWTQREMGSGAKFINGDTLLARITPCLENGKTAFVDFLSEGETGWGSTEYIVLRPRPPLPVEFGYYLTRSEEFRLHAITNMTGSSGRQRVPSDCFAHFMIAVPPASVASTFEKFVRPIMCTIRANCDQSRTAAALRDTLLPKLLSGELRVPDADKMLEEVL